MKKIYLKVYETIGTVNGKNVWATAIFHDEGDCIVDGRPALIYLLGDNSPAASAETALRLFMRDDVAP